MLEPGLDLRLDDDGQKFIRWVYDADGSQSLMRPKRSFAPILRPAAAVRAFAREFRFGWRR